MKKERAIIIKNPKLQKIRNELRTLLNLWKSDICSSLMKQASHHTMDKERSREFQEKISKIRLQYKLSICVCLHCGNSDRDMIFVPKMRQWLCIECHSERVYYEKLRTELEMDTDELIEFFERLTGEEGIGLTRRRSRCDGYAASQQILDKMGVEKEVQEQFFELCKYYGGFCDCEIILNAKARFLEQDF